MSSRQGAERPGGKKKYVAPKLVEYGSAAKLSAAKPGSFNDAANSIHMT